MSYLEAGQDNGGPILVLIHGLAGDAAHWGDVIAGLGRHTHILAPDLLGHGESDTPDHADYTVSAHASRLRDLLRCLGHQQASLVGHSFGGGVAMAFAYQFPERTHTLTLIASGGLGPELSIALRTACLPGILRAARTMHMLTPPWAARLAHHGATALGLARRADLEELGRALRALHNLDSRRAYLHTLRGVATWSGQRLDATDRLYLLAQLPILLITGRWDPCIPHEHTLRAHQLLPGSRLELLEAGHFPHVEYPDEVTALILDLLGDSEPLTDRSAS
jgi:pimeloyl-ACP methyl ester carboxylesterase